ncbi:hypothetical protein [Gloeobacter morelensis]|uniref:Uncharacterized protein n=1 Tax=Gloeobacter morelensis MG652769 TaxID=2781736 RepID=A0ABY3PJW1_9CYAN|nr:hypothetical protein [Gloeobacter morelensis]UFP93904.1 hypothetical protein ISF26_19350 [Gloeobacter morelensis MG652769]
MQLWPRRVVLNRPSELAGAWLAYQPCSGVLITDSPVVAYFSQWFPERIAGGTLPLPTRTRFIAAITDARYWRICLLLRSYPPLAAGRVPTGWQPVYEPGHWSTRYGAKPIRIFSVTVPRPNG